MHFEKFKLLQSYLKPICSLLEKSFTVFGPVMMKDTLVFENKHNEKIVVTERHAVPSTKKLSEYHPMHCPNQKHRWKKSTLSFKEIHTYKKNWTLSIKLACMLGIFFSNRCNCNLCICFNKTGQQYNDDLRRTETWQY